MSRRGRPTSWEGDYEQYEAPTLGTLTKYPLVSPTVFSGYDPNPTVVRVRGLLRIRQNTTLTDTPASMTQGTATVCGIYVADENASWNPADDLYKDWMGLWFSHNFSWKERLPYWNGSAVAHTDRQVSGHYSEAHHTWDIDIKAMRKVPPGAGLYLAVISSDLASGAAAPMVAWHIRALIKS